MLINWMFLNCRFRHNFWQQVCGKRWQAAVASNSIDYIYMLLEFFITILISYELFLYVWKVLKANKCLGSVTFYYFESSLISITFFTN